MLNFIWLCMMLVAVLVGALTGRLEETTSAATEGATNAVMKVVLPLIGIWALWLGIMRLAERAGLVQALAKFLRPLLRRLFPDVPPEHPAMGAMVMNIAANMLGIGNAATPLGLRAMRLLAQLNPHTGTASDAMVTFLALNTASVQILPLTAIGVLAKQGAHGPTAIVGSAFIATLIAATVGVFSARILSRLPVYRLGLVAESASTGASEPTVEEEKVEIESIATQPLKPAGIAALWTLAALFAALFCLLAFPDLRAALGHLTLSPAPAELATLTPGSRAIRVAGMLAIPFLLSFVPLLAALRGVRVYEQFVEGAKEAWGTAQRTLPYLVAMLAAIGMLRGSGTIEAMTGTPGAPSAFAKMLAHIGVPSDLLPLMLIRPLSGSAANGVFNELIVRFNDPDGFLSRLAATIYGSTETTFYVLAEYFGSVGIRRTRHAIVVGLTADIVATAVAIFVCRKMFAP